MENKDYQAAIDKLRDEMAAAKLPAVGAVGEIMTALLQAAPDWAGAILAKGKTLAGAYAALEKYARDNRNGNNCVFVPPETAQKVILELKDKLDLADAFEKKQEHAQQGSVKETGTESEAVMALTALGYSNSEAFRAVRSAEEKEPGTDTEGLIRLALKELYR